MIRIASIANNYGENYDGVGDFARTQNINYPDFVEYEVFTAKCPYEISKIKRIFGLGMCKAILKAFNSLKKIKFDVVMIEYPFVEWNPFILLPIYLLQKEIKKQNGIFAVSLHEYIRVNRLRKFIIELLCRMADVVLVSNQELRDAVDKYSRKVIIRPIPTNLYDEKTIYTNIEKKDNIYVYFGLINATKAFDEMIEAWDIFNKEENNTLYILSGTKLENFESSHKGVRYIYDGTSVQIISIMQTAKACLIPVKPYVDEKNTTFKTGTITGCICAGIFCDEYKKLQFTINMDDYSVTSFVKTFNILNQIPKENSLVLQREAKEFGLTYSPQYTSELVASELMGMIGEKR